MEIDGLLIPDLLLSMIAMGRWPSTVESISDQNLQSLIPTDRNRTLRSICLFPPPFRTLVNAANDDFFRTHGVIWQLKPELAVSIADFGWGADSPILLYYHKTKAEPIVINLEWRDSGNLWVVMSESFAEFVELLGI